MRILTPNRDYSFEIREVMDSDPLVVKESWVENVYQINEGDFFDTNIFIDIGANIGAVSIKVASFNDTREKKIKVIAYEPLTENIRLLSHNTKINRKESEIKLIQKGVWSKKDTLLITDAGGSSSVLPEKFTNQAQESIEVISLEDVFFENNISECDVMKIDIEGAEYNVINSSSIETLRRIKYLTLEFDGGHESEFGEMTTKLAEVFNLHIIGRPSTGGYIYGRRY